MPETSRVPGGDPAGAGDPMAAPERIPAGNALDPHLVRAMEGWGAAGVREPVFREGPLHLPQSMHWPSGWPGRTRLGAQMAYLLAGLPLAILSGLVVIIGLALGAGTFVAWIGIPITVGTLAAARGFAELERRATEAATGMPLPPHHYRPNRGRRLMGRLFRALVDPQSWRDVAHAVTALPLRAVTAAVALAWSVTGLGGLLYVFWQWSIPRGSEDWTLFRSVTGVHSGVGDIALNTGLGVLLLVTLPTVVRWLTDVRALLARGLLTNQTAALRARALALASGRRAAVAAEAQTLRRLERDIHDGPQQRLVRLGMDLESAVRRLDDDPERARPLLHEALEQTHEALSELRALSRGIAPPILADRGLGPALAAAAGRCPVPVDLDVGLDAGARLPALVENTAYFVVSEALTNIAKHAGASAVSVTVTADETLLRVVVRDDGRGGAHPGKGHGLAGLIDRLEIVEGSLDVHSPPGGPTVLTAEVPVAGLGEG
ncbi:MULTISPECIES: sensor histidine kinase [Pseudonocardia]|uniref:histidine kinase n=2 Tax=Pseudonocardia TaxID=1847 RepID=A0A1Y2MQF8_PSEAH|nr:MULTISPECIES: sensor histidine kinase [Pseudonocardia]OSY37422.1 Sensor histidine kinase LiaS [Pseudonocardia autotrophica]TDN77253.1 signal transduction histidine kinase [Pseudonocardia autotrophica]BBG01271.1 histidine kinase [Pseudonocardia autotrophica]GEC25998.1 histidine kinase [Pseudonocardia saturnea]